ncbi:hypothetical protein MKW94_029950 [Papaver nudicaule]|uniref:CCR4-NOT transcription complex subunit 4 n=1 Tax=Papaver nudicaule TaxID=74823 RepID=A0AA41UZA3_PAPNU|nr:hypothetical protein [Papaver nudicaule]
MSDEGEKVCPLCAEEMDLTDQQLRPCRCGYQICVWCWHHIMEMAEKENTEGLCPACRTPYDKEKIVATAANCERVVASERKIKSNKAKSKTDGRMRLSTVRVIQRNLVYIIGIPSNLADEDALQHKEYFGKYGKVLKVSISRTAGGAIQHSSNNTCSVYITYSKEEEAVRCIQSVHGYTLDGKPLRACFGTTKYCHAWLKNMSCSNPDCLYLHDIGTEEDSFCKDEITSAYTRSRVQQNTATTNNLDRRSGSMLPPPYDDFCIDDTTSSTKPIPKSVPNIPAPQPHIKTSPPNSSSGRSAVLPAAASWGLRASNGRHPVTGSSCSDGPVKQKPDGSFSSIVASSTQASTLHNDPGKRHVVNEESQVLRVNGRVKPLESSKQNTFRDSKSSEPDSNAKVLCISAPAPTSSDNHIFHHPTSKHSEMVVTTPPVENEAFSGSEIGIKMPPDDTLACKTASDAENENAAVNVTVENVCSGLASIGIGKHLDIENGDTVTAHQPLRLHKDQTMQQYHLGDISDPPSSLPSRKTTNLHGVSFSREQSSWSSELSSQVIPEVHNPVKEEVSAFDEQSLKFSELTHPSYSFNSSNSIKTSNQYNSHPFQLGDACSTSKLGNTVSVAVHTKVDEVLPPFEYRNFLGSSVLNLNKVVNSPDLVNSFDYSNFPPNMDDGKNRGRVNNAAAATGGGGNGAIDMGESSIISNILSMDNVWSDSLTSPNNLAPLFSDTDRQNDTVKQSSSWKAQNSNQSRFSFARQEDVGYHGSGVEPSFGNIGYMAHTHSSFQDFSENRDPYLDRHRNGFSNVSAEPDSFLSSQFSMPSDRFSAARNQISAPPGFSLPSRPAPPGFSSQERFDPTFDTATGHHLFENSPMLRNQYPPHPTNSIDDPEFIDPAILFVGKERRPNGMNSLGGGLDMRSTFTPQRSVIPDDLRLQQLLMQQSISSNQNLRYPDHIGDRFSPVTDAYSRTPSRFPEQSQITNPSLFNQLSFHQSRNGHVSNGHYDGWSEVQNGSSNDYAMAELLRNERLGGGFNKHYPGYEDLKYRMPSSSDIYNRAFGM